ncbi:hypothetical protein CALVIDRAFT_538638 [Calocera viscosa TUFC12733]|uniref:BTB domain transcription factor n=1 Tax=Calocera viscosa (strain TUFC12733) TaxID=1330018 RepID=A0A167KPE3_CALVF|nr:hypothetical protein CALVIDRAFT_538638 [Calocera viscosa TUFC12733]
MPTTRAQAAGKTNGANHEGLKRHSSAKHRGGKRAKKQKGEDVSAAKEEEDGKGEKAEEEKPAENDRDEKVEENGTDAKEEKKYQNVSAGVSKAQEIKDAPEPEGFEKGTGILERGHIYFLYRPKVELEEASSLDDVAKFSILLLPRDSPAPEGKEGKRYRFISVGKKRLPDPHKKREVFWAAVVGYGTDLKELASELGPKDYETKTRGERHIAESRLAGRGSYILYAKTDGPRSKHATYLAYHLSHPAHPGEVQKALDILPSSSFVIQVKNPTVSAPPQAGLNPSARADYPEGVVDAEFGGEGDAKGLRFVPANPVHLLDYKGAEILLIADKAEIGQVVGEEAAGEVERDAEADEGLSDEKVMQELRMHAEKFPAEALEGEWA